MNAVRNDKNLEILGQRITEVRELRQLKPLKLAAEIDGSVAGVLAWEKGERAIKPNSIKRLAETLEVSYLEEMYWHGLAGHLPKTKLPSKHQIITVLDAYYYYLAKLPYPAQIIDHQFTYWIVNPATIDFLGSRDKLIHLMNDNLATTDVMFDSDIGFFERVSRPNEILARKQQLTRRLVGRSIHRRHEPFYQDYPHFMQYRLSPTDFRQFLAVWTEANSVEQTQIVHLDDDIMLRYFEFQYLDGRQRKLQMGTDYLRQFGDIFEIIMYHPLTPESDNAYRPVAQKGAKLWEIINIDHLLRVYNED